MFLVVYNAFSVFSLFKGYVFSDWLEPVMIFFTWTICRQAKVARNVLQWDSSLSGLVL
jgi:hypothetical protein